MKSFEFKLPGRTDRTAILGRTGSGKTTMAAFLVSHADIDKKPWVIIDYKGEQIFDDIEKADRDVITNIKTTDTAPRKPGLYRVEPIPGEDDRNITEFLWRIWERQNTGIYVDEGHLLPNSDALKAVLVTGRSRKIPVIMISQRPVWVPREVFSESNHHVIFDLSREDDRKVAGSFVTPTGEAVPRMRDYHSLWNDVGRNRRFQMRPAPPAEQSIERIIERAPRRFRWL